MLKLDLHKPIPLGESYKFLNETFFGNNERKIKIGDKCFIHPIEGVSQAIQSYPVIVEANIINWSKGEFPNNYIEPKIELCIKGIDENSKWHGAVLNDYAFSRLEPIC